MVGAGKCVPSSRSWLHVVSNSLVKLSQLECFVSTLGYLADDSGRPASDDAEARNRHVGRHDGTVEYPSVVLDGSHLADNHSLADMDVASNGSGLDNRILSDEDMVAHS